MLAELSALKVKVKKLYLDRGFFSIPVIRWLQALDVPFVLPAMLKTGVFQGATSAPKARNEKGFTEQAPRQIPSLLTMTWMGVVRKDEGVSNVW